MKTLVVSQPMFLPWRGIFEQIALADVFVYYDDVQLPRGKSFNARVQIKNAQGWQWLVAPVSRQDGRLQLISETRFVDQAWRKKHLAALRASYGRAQFFDEIWQKLIVPVYEHETELLSEFCIASTRRVIELLKLPAEQHVSSQIKLEAEGGSDRILALCKHFAADRYVSGKGGMNYLQHEVFSQAGTEVEYMDYTLSPYPQLHGEFNPYVSIIDLLVHVGPEAARAHLTSRARNWREWPELTNGSEAR